MKSRIQPQNQEIIATPRLKEATESFEELVHEGAGEVRKEVSWFSPLSVNQEMLKRHALFGGVFFALLACLVWTSAAKPYPTIVYIIMAILLIFSAVGFYSFVSLKIVHLYTDSLRISWILLPFFKKSYRLQEIKSITKKVRDVDVGTSRWRSATASVTEVKTLIELTNGKQIKLYTISPLNFAELSTTFTKLKNGENNLTAKTINWKIYLIDNLGGLAWTVFFLLIVIGLSHSILAK